MAILGQKKTPLLAGFYVHLSIFTSVNKSPASWVN